MTFEEALKELKAGKYIQKGFVCYKLENDKIYVYHTSINFDTTQMYVGNFKTFQFSDDNKKANDWTSSDIF